jgi:hypothetical protein
VAQPKKKRFVASGLTPPNIAIVAFSWFPLPSQAFFLDTIEEAYNINSPLIFYQKKSGFRSMCCLFTQILFLVGRQSYSTIVGDSSCSRLVGRAITGFSLRTLLVLSLVVFSLTGYGVGAELEWRQVLRSLPPAPIMPAHN